MKELPVVDWQPLLENAYIQIRPLMIDDREALYTAASDPLIWEQHPVKDRYRREVFDLYFREAMESNGALLVINKQSGNVIGCSRFYDYKPAMSSVAIGFTFLSRDCWGKVYNKALKYLMLEHAFQFVDHIIFQVGPDNLRSQKALEQLGIRKMTREEAIQFEEKNEWVVYLVSRPEWKVIKSGLLSYLK